MVSYGGSGGGFELREKREESSKRRGRELRPRGGGSRTTIRGERLAMRGSRRQSMSLIEWEEVESALTSVNNLGDGSVVLLQPFRRDSQLVF